MVSRVDRRGWIEYELLGCLRAPSGDTTSESFDHHTVTLAYMYDGLNLWPRQGCDETKPTQDFVTVTCVLSMAETSARHL